MFAVSQAVKKFPAVTDILCVLMLSFQITSTWLQLAGKNADEALVFQFHALRRHLRGRTEENP